MHHFSSLCSVSWLLMSGYLSYPRESPSLSLFGELSDPSVIAETGELSRVFQAFKVSRLKILSLYILFKLTRIFHNLIACVRSRLRKEIYGVITPCLKGSYLCEPPSQVMFVTGYGATPAGTVKPQWKYTQNTSTGFHWGFFVVVVWDNQIRVQCGVDDGGRWWTLSLLCDIFFFFFYPELLFHCTFWTWLSALTLSGKTKHTGKSRHLISVVLFPFFFFSFLASSVTFPGRAVCSSRAGYFKAGESRW